MATSFSLTVVLLSLLSFDGIAADHQESPILYAGLRADAPAVMAFDAQGGEQGGFFAFTPLYSGGVSLATGDLNSDGIDDIIIGASSGLAHVRVIDGSLDASGDDAVPLDFVIGEFFAFNTGYLGGVNVAVGDVNGDGVDDIILGAARGLAHVRVVDGTMLGGLAGEISDDGLLADFFAFNVDYTGGVNVAAGDVNGDGFDDIIVGANTGLAHVRVVDGGRAVELRGEVDSSSLLADFFAFNVNYTGGVNVAAGDVNGDGRADIITGAATGLAHVRVVDGAQAPELEGEPDASALLANFFAFNTSFTGGVTVASGDINEDGFDDIITGANIGLAHVRVVNADGGVFGEVTDKALLADFLAFDPAFTGGVRVAAGIGPIAAPLFIDDLLSAVDEAFETGSLTGAGPGRSARGRAKAWRSKLDEIHQSIQWGRLEEACEGLWELLRRTDGHPQPPDFVRGEARANIEELIREVAEALGCRSRGR